MNGQSFLKAIVFMVVLGSCLGGGNRCVWAMSFDEEVAAEKSGTESPDVTDPGPRAAETLRPKQVVRVRPEPVRAVSPVETEEQEAPVQRKVAEEPILIRKEPVHVAAEASTEKDMSAVDKKYVLRNGDRLNVAVFPEDEYIKGGEVTISEEGNIRISTAGKFTVAGKTIAETEAEILVVLEEYFVDPEVTIEVLAAQEMTVVLLGEIKQPGTYPIPVGRSQFTLMEGIALGGGFSEIANIKKITITRKTENGQNIRIQANAEAIIQGQEEDVDLQADDIVHVKESFF